MTGKAQKGTLGVIIAAGGSSVRMGSDDPKVLIQLGGKPILAWSLEIFNSMDETKEIVVAALPAKIQEFERVAAPFKKVRVTGGGASRMESVARGAKRLSEGLDFIAVHDGARPLITSELVRVVLESAAEAGAAAPALTPAETVKQADGQGRILKTIDRGLLRLVQTPQIFQAELFKEALAAAGVEKRIHRRPRHGGINRREPGACPGRAAEY